jgi:hypothetical protein
MLELGLKLNGRGTPLGVPTNIWKKYDKKIILYIIYKGGKT